MIEAPRTASWLITGRSPSTRTSAPATAVAPCGSLTRTRAVNVVEPGYAFVTVGLVPPAVSKLPLPSRSHS